MLRQSGRGGGVSIYVNNCFKCKILHNMSWCINDIMECVSVELGVNNSKNYIISCVYRKPGSSIEEFCNGISNSINCVKTNSKTFFLCGDFNIDLLKYSSNVSTKHFVDVMYSMGFSPLILRPSRITADTATLIDNIFVNDINMCQNVLNGLLISDITDHLPVFSLAAMRRKLMSS